MRDRPLDLQPHVAESSQCRDEVARGTEEYREGPASPHLLFLPCRDTE